MPADSMPPDGMPAERPASPAACPLAVTDEDALRADGLSLVVLSWNTVELTLACLKAVAADPSPRAREVIVVDNASGDGSADRIAEAYPGVVLLRNHTNRLYAAANNQGAQAARGKWLCTLNSDTEVRSGALEALVEFLGAHPDYGAASPRLVYPDGSVQPACKRFPGPLTALTFENRLAKGWPGRWLQDRYMMRDFDHLSDRDVPQPPGAVFCMDRSEFLEMGGLDEALPLYFNDVDMSRRLWRRGRKIRYLAGPEVMHHEGASTRRNTSSLVRWFRNRNTYYRKHYGWWIKPWMRLVVWLRLREEFQKVRREAPNEEARQNAIAHLRELHSQVWATDGDSAVVPGAHRTS